MPKSSSFGSSRPAREITMTFSGLRSRWTMPFSWAVCTTSQMRSSRGTNRSIGIGPCVSSSARKVEPRTRSMAIQQTPSGSAPNA